jgi:hypothetical protein
MFSSTGHSSSIVEGMRQYARTDQKHMKLPFAELAVVQRAKLTDYLLSTAHPQGRSKAYFFQSLGFSVSDPKALEEQLLRLAEQADMTETVTEYGPKYQGSGLVRSPSGRTATMTTVWILRDGEPPPLLVTAYPG